MGIRACPSVTAMKEEQTERLCNMGKSRLKKDNLKNF